MNTNGKTQNHTNICVHGLFIGVYLWGKIFGHDKPKGTTWPEN